LGRIQSTIKAPAEIVSHAVRLDHVFGLSLRDVELILSEPGILVTHERSRHWRPKFGADFARTLRRRQHNSASASAACCTVFGAP
jgi:transposase-like protein